MDNDVNCGKKGWRMEGKRSEVSTNSMYLYSYFLYSYSASYSREGRWVTKGCERHPVVLQKPVHAQVLYSVGFLLKSTLHPSKKRRLTGKGASEKKRQKEKRKE